MQLHQLISDSERRRKRIGRGGKRGSYSGRGVKGQKSRSGRRIRPAERDLIIRLPKFRGFANKPKSEKSVIFNLGDLSLALKSAGGASVSVNTEFLKQKSILPSKFKGEVKILGNGEISVPVHIEGLKVSKGAKAKIEKAGGSVIESKAKSANDDK